MISQETCDRKPYAVPVQCLGRPDMECSWVQSELVPKQLITEYKNGCTTDVVLKSTAYYQQQTTILEQLSDGMYEHTYIIHMAKHYSWKYW